MLCFIKGSGLFSLSLTVHIHSLTHSAMDKFKGLDKRAQAGTSDTALDCTHQNAITQIFPHSGARESISKFSTTGVDGRLVVWTCKSLESSIAGLTIR